MDDDVYDIIVKDVNASSKSLNHTNNYNTCLHCLQLMFQKIFHKNFRKRVLHGITKRAIKELKLCSVIYKIVISLKNEAKKKLIRMQTNSCYLSRQLRKEEVQYKKRYLTLS